MGLRRSGKQTSTLLGIFIGTQSLEEWSVKAKGVPSPLT